jgi:hypothetical protein
MTFGKGKLKDTSLSGYLYDAVIFIFMDYQHIQFFNKLAPKVRGKRNESGKQK